MDLETQAAARRHLGQRYDQRVASIDAAWVEAEQQGLACARDLDLTTCDAAAGLLRGFLGRPATLRMAVSGGTDAIHTDCGPERVFFDGKPITFDTPHRDEARALLDDVLTVQRTTVKRPSASQTSRPPGVPYDEPQTPLGPKTGLTIRALYVEQGNPDIVVGTLQTHRGRLKACVMGIHPGWREERDVLTLTWRVHGGRALEVRTSAAGTGSTKLRACVQRVVAEMPLPSADDGRVSVVLEMSAP